MTTRDVFVAGLITGTVMGAVAALLLAPKAGKETRQLIAARADEVWRKFRARIGAESLPEPSARQAELSG